MTMIADLTQAERDFCASSLYPITGIGDMQDGRLAEHNARIRTLVRFQKRNGLTKKAAAEALNVSPAKFARWIDGDAEIPAEVAFAASKAAAK